jgi:hypothetical protein
MKQFLILVIIGLFFSLLLSFQNSGKNDAVEALKEKALGFESKQENDSAAFYFLKARGLAEKIKSNKSLKSVLEAEITFWVSREDKEMDEVNKKLQLLWDTYRSDAKFRTIYYEAKSILFLNNSDRDSFQYFFNETVNKIFKSSFKSFFDEIRNEIFENSFKSFFNEIVNKIFKSSFKSF